MLTYVAPSACSDDGRIPRRGWKRLDSLLLVFSQESVTMVVFPVGDGNSCHDPSFFGEYSE